MGQSDQFAKRTFAAETGPLTQGVVAWRDPPEIGLTHLQADGALLVLDPARLASLDPPWPDAQGHDEILIEIKMPNNHINLAAIERALSRRQARQVERVEDKQA